MTEEGTNELLFLTREMVAEEGLETPNTRIMIKLLQLFIFNFSALQALKSGVLKSV